MELRIILLAITCIAPAIAAILGIRAVRHPMFYYVVIAALTELTTIILKFNLNQDIQWAGNFFLALELFLFSVFFYRIIKPKWKWLFWSGIIALEAWFLGYSAGSWFMVFNRFGACLLCVIYTVMCLICYRSILKNQHHQFIEQSSSFWIINGIFIYAATTSVVFALPEILKSDLDFFNKVWSYFYIVINFIRYMLIGIGLRLYTKYGD